MAKTPKESSKGKPEKPASQQRGRATGPHLTGPSAPKEKVEELLDEWADDIQNSEE